MILPQNTQILDEENNLALATKEQDGSIIASGGASDLTCLVQDGEGNKQLAVKVVNIDGEIVAKSKTSTQVLTDGNQLANATLEQDGNVLATGGKTGLTCLIETETGKQTALKTVSLDGEIISGGTTDLTCLVQDGNGVKQLALKSFSLGGGGNWHKPSDWSDIRKDCPKNSIALYAAHKDDFSQYDNLGFTATCTGGYNVFIDGTQYGSTYASGATCSITWSTSGITTGDDITTPSALKAHKIWIEPATEGNDITAFHCARVAESGQEQQGVLWAHFNLSNRINLGSCLNNESNYYKNLLTEAVTAKNNLLNISALYYAFANSPIKYFPVIVGEDNNKLYNLYSTFRGVFADKITLKDMSNTYSTSPSFSLFENSKVKKILGNYICKPSAEMFKNCQYFEQLPENIDFSGTLNLVNFLTNAVSLKDTVLDTRAGTGIVKIGCYGNSTYFMTGFKGLRVSNEAPFDNATPPQINVSYTGMDRAAIVQLFNDLPTVSDGQIINITGTTGSSNLSDEELAIATDKGWTVIGGPAYEVFATYNGASIGDTIKLNDGMATSTYDWSAYPNDTAISGSYTKTATVTAVHDNIIEIATKPTQESNTITINAGEIYYAWTDGINTYYTKEADLTNSSILYDNTFNIISPQPAIEISASIFPATQDDYLTADGTLGGDSFAVSAQYASPFYAWYPFAENANTDLYKTWAKSGNTADYIMYSPTPMKVISFDITNRNDGTGVRPIVSGTVYGSNNGTDYYELTTFTNSDTTINSTWNLPVNSTTAYNYYKISGVSNNTGYIGIGKIKINASTDVLINNVVVTYDSSKNIVQSINCNIDTIDNTTIQSVIINSTQTADISTETRVTTSYNGVVITDGEFKSFNITVPSGMSAIIQNNGTNYQLSDMPLQVKTDSGIGILITNNNNVYYRNSLIIQRNYDLHYQQINFSYPTGATVTCRVNNVPQSDLTPYVYAGDTVTWTCDNAGTVTTGSYTVKYSVKDGNIQTITIS